MKLGEVNISYRQIEKDRLKRFAELYIHIWQC